MHQKKCGVVCVSRTFSHNGRLEELDEEWDIERTLEANAASFSLLGLSLGFFVDRRWFVLPTAVAAFLLQHAVQGWCSPVPLFWRLGIRTNRKINQKRHALNALRVDYKALNNCRKARITTSFNKSFMLFVLQGRFSLRTLLKTFSFHKFSEITST